MLNPEILDLIPCIGLGVAFFIVCKVASKQTRVLKEVAMRRNGQVRKRFGIFPRLILPLMHNEVIVYSNPGGKNIPPKTIVTIKFKTSRQNQLRIYRKPPSRFFSNLTWKGIRVNNPEFYENYIVSGKDKYFALQLIDSEIQRHLLDVKDMYPTISIFLGEINFSIRSYSKQANEFDAVIDAALPILDKFLQKISKY